MKHNLLADRQTGRQADRQTGRQAEFLSSEISRCIKGLAAVMVMLGHYCSKYQWFVSAFFPGQIWVGVFFFFSGYGLRFGFEKKEQYLDGFLKKRILSTYLPFCFAELLYGLARIASGESLSAGSFLKGIIGIQLLNSILWYVIEILVLYLLFYIIYRTIHKDWIWIPIYLAFLGTCALLDVGTWWYTSTSAFLLGIYIQKLEDKFIRIIQRYVVLLATVTVLLYCFRIGIQESFFYIGFLPVNQILTGLDIVIIPLFLLVCLGIPWKTVNSTLFAFIGGISYEIYLYHMLSLTIISRIISSTGVTVFVSTIMAIGIAWIVNKFWNVLRKRLLINNSDFPHRK